MTKRGEQTTVNVSRRAADMLRMIATHEQRNQRQQLDYLIEREYRRIYGDDKTSKKTVSAQPF